MEKLASFQGIQTATGLALRGGRCTKLQQQASSGAALPLNLAGHHLVEDESRKLSVERAKVRRRRMHDGVLALKLQQAYQAGAFVEIELSRHIRRSLPGALRAK